MADETFDTLEFVGRQVHDYSIETDDSGHKFSVELPGTYEVGLRMNGVFRPIATFPAAGFLADMKRAQVAAEATAPPAPSAPSEPPAQPTQ